MRLPVLTLVLAVVLANPPSTATAQTARKDVLAAVDGFMRGLQTKDTALVAQHIDSLTRMTLPRTGQNGVRLVALRAPDLIRMVATQPASDERIRNPVVQVDGDAATVWAEYQSRRDGAVTHCGYDAFQLARLGGKWKVINIIDSFRQTGCGNAWP